MPKQRRTAFDAIDGESIAQFIQNGKPPREPAEESAMPPPVTEESSESAVTSDRSLGDLHENALTSRRQMDRTLSKARIQKSIRFRPELIARFEELLDNQQRTGARPFSIQEAMNQALDEWLNRQDSIGPA